MDEEEYLSLRPILPNYEIIGGPILSDNAITVRRENIPGADTPRGFGRGQAAARLLREGRLRANRHTVNRNAPNGQYTPDGNFPEYFEIFGQHGNDDSFIRINEHTPLADTYDVSRIAAVDPTNLEMLPAAYFPPSDAGGHRNNEHMDVINDVGYFRPELDPNKAIPEISMPWEDKANVYAHQLVRGLSDTLRQFGITEEELRNAGISGGYAGLNGDSLHRLRLSGNRRVVNAIQAFMGAPDYGRRDSDTDAHFEYLKETDKYLRDNYRDAPYVRVTPGDGERYTDLTAPHTYAKGGRMQNASMRPWEKRSGTTYQYLQEQDRARREKKQKEIESMVDIDDMAIRALRGEFGNGAERKKHLGAVYSAVQRRVNEMLTELQSRRAADAKRRETEANRAMERRADGLTPQRGVRPSVSEPSRETIRSGGQSMSRLDGDDEYDMYF